MFGELGYICTTEHDWTLRKLGTIIFDIVDVALTVWVLTNIDEIRYQIGRDFENFEIILWIVIVVGTISQIISTIQVFFNSRSYIRVYEDHVEGVTRVPFGIGLLGDLSEQSKTFSLKYHEILHADSSREFITLHTQFGKYEAMALENQSWALGEIRGRISTKN